MRPRPRPHGGPRHRLRLVVVAALVVSVFGLLLGRLGQVQIGAAPVAFAAAGRAAAAGVGGPDVRTVTVPALRGRILDAQGEPLTANAPGLVVTLDRRTLADAPDGGRSLVDRLAAAVGRPAQALWEKTFVCGSPGSTPAPACSR